MKADKRMAEEMTEHEVLCFEKSTVVKVKSGAMLPDAKKRPSGLLHTPPRGSGLP